MDLVAKATPLSDEMRVWHARPTHEPGRLSLGARTRTADDRLMPRTGADGALAVEPEQSITGSRAAPRPLGTPANGARAATRVGFDVEAMRRYVLSRLTPEGGYSFYRVPSWGVEEPNAPDTLAALASLRLLGIPPPEPEHTVRYLKSLQRHDGGYPSFTIGWAAISSLRLLSSPPERSPDQWLEGWAVALTSTPQRGEAASLRDGARLIEIEVVTGKGPDARVLRWAGELLDTAADPAGGWARPEADLETTGLAVSLAARAAWRPPDVAVLGEFLRRCEDPVLGLRVRPDAAATSAGALWGGLLLAGAARARLRHPGALSRSLVLLQRRDGGLGSRHLAISSLQDTWRGLEAAALLDQLTGMHNQLTFDHVTKERS